MFIVRIVTIIALISGGIIAASSALSKRWEWAKQASEGLQKFDIVIGLILIAVGLLKIFVPEGTSSWVYPLKRQFFIGDLFPMLTALLLGIILSAGMFANIAGKEGKEKLYSFADTLRVPAGFAGIIFGILHNFLFYYSLF